MIEMFRQARRVVIDDYAHDYQTSNRFSIASFGAPTGTYGPVPFVIDKEEGGTDLPPRQWGRQPN